MRCEICTEEIMENPNFITKNANLYYVHKNCTSFIDKILSLLNDTERTNKIIEEIKNKKLDKVESAILIKKYL